MRYTETEPAQVATSSSDEVASIAEEYNSSRMYSIVGYIALGALVACIALALWVAFADAQPYAERLASYRVWLAWASVTHLISCAIWVMAKVR
jgi:hypothetical protein